MTDGEQIRAGHAIADGIASLLRPPFRLLVVLTALVPIVVDSLAAPQVPLQQTEWAVAVLLVAVQFYIEIAATLAAGRTQPDPSTDHWLKAGWRRRCFWRLVGASIMSFGALISGLLLAGIGIFFVGAVIAFAPIAAVLERRGPLDAVARSVTLTKGHRVPIGIVVAVMVVIPFLGEGAATVAEVPQRVGPAWSIVSAATEILGLAGTIALTRMFVALGGEATPAVIEAPRARERI